MALGKKMKVQAGIKSGKQTGKRAGIGQASDPNRMKNGLNGSSIHAYLTKKGFYAAYTLRVTVYLSQEKLEIK